MNRLLWVGLATLLAALIVALLPGADTLDQSKDGGVTLPEFRVEIELGADGMSPYRVQVPRDHEVHLVVRAGPEAPEGLLTVMGYEDQVRPLVIGPGQAREMVFESLRPGDDFALSLDGDLLGRLQVTGSHMAEGHQ